MLTMVQYLVAAGLLVLLLGRGQPPPEVEVPAIEARFEGQRAYVLVRELAERFPKRVTDTPQDEAAGRWMAEQFQALGLRVVEQRFEVWGSLDPSGASGDRFAGLNVLGISSGVAPQAIVIGAHRDVVPETGQGAVDNASGSGTILELARVLAAVPHHYTYVFASWGAEEVGLGGSRYYVGHSLHPTVLALSMDVNGLTERGELMLMDWASLPLEPALLVERMAMDQGVLSRPQTRGLLDLAGLPGARAAGTDSSPFAFQGIPALGIGWETPHGQVIHTAADTIDQVDVESLELTGRLAETLVRVAEGRGPPFLAGPPLYLRREDGSIVPETRVLLAALVMGLFAFAHPALAFLGARRAGLRGGLAGQFSQSRLLDLCVLAAVVVAALPWLLGLWQEPSGQRFLLWVGAVVLALLPLGVAARRVPPQLPPGRRLAFTGLLALAFAGLAAMANPYLAALLFAYPLLVLPLLTFRPRWWRALDALLILPWIPLALGLLAVAQAYGSFATEYAPTSRVVVFEGLVALVLYATVAYALVRRAADER